MKPDQKTEILCDPISATSLSLTGEAAPSPRGAGEGLLAKMSFSVFPARALLGVMRQRAEQFHQFSEGGRVRRNNLTDRFAPSFRDESLVAISHTIQNF